MPRSKKNKKYKQGRHPNSLKNLICGTDAGRAKAGRNPNSLAALAKHRTQEHQIKAATLAGQIASETGQIQSAAKLGGLATAKTGFFNSLQWLGLGAHHRFHLQRGISNMKCRFCRREHRIARQRKLEKSEILPDNNVASVPDQEGNTNVE